MIFFLDTPQPLQGGEPSTRALSTANRPPSDEQTDTADRRTYQQYTEIRLSDLQRHDEDGQNNDANQDERSCESRGHEYMQ